MAIKILQLNSVSKELGILKRMCKVNLTYLVFVIFLLCKVNLTRRRLALEKQSERISRAIWINPSTVR